MRRFPILAGMEDDKKLLFIFNTCKLVSLPIQEGMEEDILFCWIFRYRSDKISQNEVGIEEFIKLYLKRKKFRFCRNPTLVGI